MTLLCKFHRVVKKAASDDEDEEEEEQKEWYVSNSAVPFTPTSNNFMYEGARRLDEKMANYSTHGSNWAVQRIIKVGFIFTKFEDMCRIAGHSYIPLPEVLDNPKMGLVNPMNMDDNLCFLYAILAVAKYDQIEAQHQRISNYVEFLDELVYDEKSMPMRICQIPKFERHNAQYRINVLRYNDNSDEEEDVDEEEEQDVFSNPHFHIIYRSRNENKDA